jgi:SpoVK/Ycf46/Vps4 family AAA+-type ATPase
MSINAAHTTELKQCFEEVRIGGNRVFLPPPDPVPAEPFVGRSDLIEQALAAWCTLDGSPPQHFRLYGPPGTGKNALVYELSRILEKDLYIIEGNDDLRVEDIACIPTIDPENTGRLRYNGSPLFAAMLRGGIAFFDEIGKAPPGALSRLASVLDRRRTLTSETAAIRIQASSDFLFCAALNEDEETGIGLPDYISERTVPAIYVGNPSMEEMKVILKSQTSGQSEAWIKGFITEFKDSNVSPRVAIELIRNATKLYKMRQRSKSKERLTKRTVAKYLREAAAGFPVEPSEVHVPSKGARKEEKPENVYDLVPKEKRGSLH